MKRLLLVLIYCQFAQAEFKNFDIGKLFTYPKTPKDIANIVAQVGLNCVQDPTSPKVLLEEIKNIVEGVAKVAAESVQMTLYKKGFPNICHVMTNNHLNTYSEGTNTEFEKKCVLKRPGGCLASKKIKKERPMPSYYWPLYFVEVNEKGNDSHHKFAESNFLYSLNRRVAKGVTNFIDEAGAVKLTALVMGANNGLKAVGLTGSDSDIAGLGKVSVLTPFEKMRIRANKESDMKSFDVNIWPVALSKTVAKHFSVCGKVREQSGLRPGGYSWGTEGVPMTCPVAMSQDVFALWDTGMLDYLDPEAVGAMAVSSNPASCGMAQGARYLSDLGDKATGKKAGNFIPIESSISSMGGKLRSSLRSCSFPLLGESHAIAKQALSVSDPDKWKQLKCTLWGSVAPRMSTSVYENDYSYANTALKFKMLAHDLFGIPRGREERWSQAYPWESNPVAGGIDYFTGFLSKINELIGKDKINLDSLPKTGRSYSLLTPGSPLMVNASVSSKHIVDQGSNFTKELAYIAAIQASSVAARSAMEKNLSKAQDSHSQLKEELIWEKRKYCDLDGRKWIIKGNENCFNAVSSVTDPNSVLTIGEEMIQVAGRQVPSPWVREYSHECKTAKSNLNPKLYKFKGYIKTCKPVLVREYQIPAYKNDIPNNNPSTLTTRTDTQDAILMASAAAPWVASEIARNKLSEMTGFNPVKGDRRIYTIWEKIECTYPSTRLTISSTLSPIDIKKYESCRATFRYEAYKYVQKELLRRICDGFGSTEGLPWK